MAQPDLVDLYVDAQGELAVGVNGDLLVERHGDVVMTEIRWRLKTYLGDWVLEPECGASLESLIGRPLTAATAAEMEALIYRALTHDAFLVGELKKVKVVPVNREQLVGLIVVEYGDETFTDTVTLDLKEGVLG